MVKYLRNAELLINQRELPKSSIEEIVEDESKVVTRSDDSHTVVSQGSVDGQTVRVVFSEDPDYGGSPTNPLVINTMVLGNVAPGQVSGASGS